MFWSKQAKPTLEGMEQAEICQLEAEALYRSGSHHCAEAVMESIRKHFAPDVPEISRRHGLRFWRRLQCGLYLWSCIWGDGCTGFGAA